MFLKLILLAGVLLSTFTHLHANETARNLPPKPQRELRAAWVCSVANIDWPSAPGLPVADQQREMIEILDSAKRLNLNAIIFQARPSCDALYASKLEPWSDFLTGIQGQAPVPFYDPLEFTINEAHRRGLELHAWINPYRARHPSSKGTISAQHVSKAHPKMAVKYGKHMWLDPGQKAVQDFSLAVIMDIVARYDVDGIHLDDYFYPYREKDADGKEIDFPDEASWMEFVGEGGLITRDNWRRQNVNTFIQRAYEAIKEKKQWVKFGVSPFGIWQPGVPRQIQGFNAYEQIYCDSKKWLNEGWLDYIAPQLYWKIEATAQSYPVLLKWWVDQNTKNRHIWAGNFTSRVNDQWESVEIVNQIKATRAQEGASGNIHFSMKPLLQNRANITDELAKQVYSAQALVPEMTWEKAPTPGTPTLTVKKTSTGIDLKWKPAPSEQVWQWALQMRIGGEWILEVYPGTMSSIALEADSKGKLPDFVAITAVNRYGSLSPSAAQNVQ